MVLRLIQPLVCRAKQRFDCRSVLRVKSTADADGEAGAVCRRGERLDESANAFGDRAEAGAFDLRNDHGEFLAAVARGKVDGAHRDLQRACDALQRVVAREVPILVVVLLKAIEIEHQDSELLGIAHGAVNLVVNLFLERAEVRQVGQLVRARVLAQLVGHVVERGAEFGDLVVAGDRRLRVEIAARDAAGSVNELLEWPNDAMQRDLHRRETAHDHDPRDGESGDHQPGRRAGPPAEAERDCQQRQTKDRGQQKDPRPEVHPFQTRTSCASRSAAANCF